MKRYCMIATLCLFILSALPAFADDIERINAQQGYLSFQLLRDNNILIKKELNPISSDDGVLMVGSHNSYPSLHCEPGGRALNSIELYSGMIMHHKIDGNEVILKIALYEVSSPESEIKALKGNDCRNLAPHQRTAFEQTIRIPYEKSGEAKVTPLKGGYELRSQVAPLLP